MALWLTFGLAINANNLQDFDLQQGGVEAIVENHHFYLEGLKKFKPRGDTFKYQGHTYAAKQPGQFMSGAVVYFFLHSLGLSYVNNYLLVAALVTFFTTSLLTAISALVVFRLARDLIHQTSQLWPLVIALIFSLGTTAFSYSGIAHHDAIASACLVIGFYLVFKLAPGRLRTGRLHWLIATLAGLFLGFTITTSMLPSLMVAVVGLYFLSLRRWRLLLPFVGGGVLGLAPLFMYDAISFGNPFLLPNIAGNYSDTFFHLSWPTFFGKLKFYLISITYYVPVFWAGSVGLLFLGREHLREAVVLPLLVAILAFYILNIDTVGTCAYGPRYLMPAMSFVSVGLIGWQRLFERWKYPAIAAVVLLGAYSVAVNLIGAVQGAMYCDANKFAFTEYLRAIARGQVRSFPLLPWLLPLIPALSLLASRVRTGHKPAEKDEIRSAD